MVTKANGYETLLAHFSYDELEEERKIASLLSYQVDGLILTESHHTPRTLQMIKNAGIPVVETMELPSEPIDMAVGLDHEDASYAVVKQMLDTEAYNRLFWRASGYANQIADARLRSRDDRSRARTQTCINW